MGLQPINNIILVFNNIIINKLINNNFKRVAYNNIKLLVTDVDGTLLDNDSKLSSQNKEAVLACKSKGIGIVLATGKSIDSILWLIKLLDLKLPQITLNGAVIVDSKLKKIYSKKIPHKYYYDLIRTIKKKGYSPLISLDNGKIFMGEYHKDMKHLEKIGEKLIKVDSVETDYFSKNVVDIYIAIKETDPLDSYLRERFSNKLQFIRSGEYFFDILDLGVTKGTALKYLAKMLNISKDEIVVFGDSPNDLSMFNEAGLRIAVANSYPEVLNKADIITDENYNCGLSKAIYKYVLE